jgi:hypothetical protein
MVAKIISGKSLRGALLYNENKVMKNKAELIGQNAFHMEINHLTMKDKIHRLENLSLRNQRVRTNTVHISLNFATGEKLSKDRLNAIATDYMRGIGFEKQPYLIYQHKDAGHEHIHIVSTNIRTDGTRISLHNLGKTKSEISRKQIEKDYQLVPAQHGKLNHNINITKVIYGKCETKRAINNVLNEVLKSYKFTSIPELNAVLRRFNVVADLGSKDSRMFLKEGLIYWALDTKGQKVGVPIKASSMYGKPTLKYLKPLFQRYTEQRKSHKASLKSLIYQARALNCSQKGFALAMASKNVEVIYRANKEDRLYGITFVDHNSKCVFNGSDLGKYYSANTFEDYFKSASSNKEQETPFDRLPNIHPQDQNSTDTLIEILLEPDFQDGTTFKSLKQKFSKKKKIKS